MGTRMLGSGHVCCSTQAPYVWKKNFNELHNISELCF